MARLVITCLRGARQGARFDFESTRVTFGRHPENHFVLPEEDVATSGRHAEITQRDGRWYLRDLGSLNGTWIDDVRVTGERALDGTTVVELGRGGPLMRVEIGESDRAAVNRTALVPAMVEGGKRRSTAFYKLLIDDTVKRSNRRLKLVIIGLSALFLAIVAVLWFVLSQRTERLSEETASVRAAEQVATRYAKSIFMLIADDGERAHGFCTAFAISADGVLASNAHCVRELKDLRARTDAGGRRTTRVLARMNTQPDKTFEVMTWKEHPEYDGTDLSPDVALIGLDLRGETLPVVAEVASAEGARALGAGQPIYTLGFPGQVMNEARPVADLRAAVVSRLTARDNTPGDAASAYVVWHSALTSKGTSGSPIFDAAGRVVAVNNGGLSAREITTTDPATGKLARLVISEATGLNYGIRVDKLADLWVAR